MHKVTALVFFLFIPQLMSCSGEGAPAPDATQDADVSTQSPDVSPDTVSPLDARTATDATVVSDATVESDVPQSPDQVTDIGPVADTSVDLSPTPDTAPDASTASDATVEDTNSPDLIPQDTNLSCAGDCPSGTLCLNGQCTTNICGLVPLDTILVQNDTEFSNQLLQSQLPDLSWSPSSIYTWADFLTALHGMCQVGVGDFTFWTGEDITEDATLASNYALVNIAAFLAQSMKETIKYDACDENNWDQTNGYKLSNACGQLGQNYANYDCEMACPEDPSMQMSAVTNAKWYGAPGPLFCAPDSVLIEAGLSTDGSTGYWNHGSDCWPYPATELGFTPSDLPPYMRPACEVYAGQKGGGYVFDGSGGSVEGCCWWGRGVIQTTGRCNFGTLNHYLGQTHLDSTQFPAPETVLYPDVDFCQNPQVLCSSSEHPELKWVAGLFYWMSSVQTYDQEGWNFKEELKTFVDGGLQGDAFIDAVSGIVNRGCHNPPCGTGPLDGGPERRENFNKALTVMGLK